MLRADAESCYPSPLARTKGLHTLVVARRYLFSKAIWPLRQYLVACEWPLPSRFVEGELQHFSFGTMAHELLLEAVPIDLSFRFLVVDKGYSWAVLEQLWRGMALAQLLL